MEWRKVEREIDSGELTKPKPSVLNVGFTVVYLPQYFARNTLI